MAIDADTAASTLTGPAGEDASTVQAVPGAPDEGAAVAPDRRVHSPLRLAVAVAAVAALALTGIVSWLAYCGYQTREADKQWNMFVEVGKQGALNLTTINWQQADADVARILDSTTGSFHDEFVARAPMFTEVVKQAKSVTQATVTEVGVESQDGDQAQVIVAVTVRESNGGVPEDHPKMWRMRIGVQKVADGAKVSAVQFVP
jgi:Mce-associated membrane protein